LLRVLGRNVLLNDGPELSNVGPRRTCRTYPFSSRACSESIGNKDGAEYISGRFGTMAEHIGGEGVHDRSGGGASSSSMTGGSVNPSSRTNVEVLALMPHESAFNLLDVSSSPRCVSCFIALAMQVFVAVIFQMDSSMIGGGAHSSSMVGVQVLASEITSKILDLLPLLRPNGTGNNDRTIRSAVDSFIFLQ